MALSQRAAELFDAADATPLSGLLGNIASLASRISDRIVLPANLGFLDNVGVIHLIKTDHGSFETDQLRLLFATEIALDLPGLDGTALVLGSNETGGTLVDLEVD